MKKSFFAFGLILSAVALISCSAISSDADSASLSVRLPSKTAARSVGAASSAVSSDSDEASESYWWSEVSYFTVEIASSSAQAEQARAAAQGKGEESSQFGNASENGENNQGITQQYYQKKRGEPGKSVDFVDIPVGWYTVTVLALSGDNATLGGGSSSAAVEEGRNTQVAIELTEYKSSDDSDDNDGDNGVTPTPADDSDTELDFDGKASFNGKEYETLADALNAAAGTAATSSSSVNTIMLTGNMKANLPTTQDEATGEVFMPWKIQQNTILDLNGKTLSWSKFTDENELNPIENPLFEVAPGKALLIKNGTITSESGVEHANILIGTVGGTVALKDVTIEGVTAPYVLSINYSVDEKKAGGLYCGTVTIKNCVGTAVAIDGVESLGVPISVNNSEFYAKATNIIDTTGANGLHAILMNDTSLGAFVGGSITLNKETSISKIDGSAIALISSSLYVSSATVFANSSYYGAPVKVVASGEFNLAKGFEFKTFSESEFAGNYEKNNDGSNWITVETLGLTESESRVMAGASVSDSNSTQTAVVLGKKAETATSETDIKGQLFVSGNASVYGVVDLFYKSSIGVTGKLTSSDTIKVKFEDIASYGNANGDYPLFWASGSDRASDTTADAAAIPEKFTVYGDDEYIIGASGRFVQYAGTNDEKNGNTIYAPVARQ